jgi:hypothetical protein
MAIYSFPVEYSDSALRSIIRRQGIEPTDESVEDLWWNFRACVGNELDTAMLKAVNMTVEHIKFMRRD